MNNSFSGIIEIPTGSRHKYEYDHELGMFVLNRILFPAMTYPGNYGFIPNTLAKDGDPLDILIIESGSIDRGTLVQFYPIGALNMYDDGDEDIKIIGVPTFYHRQDKLQTLDDLDPYFVEQIIHFFSHYKDLDNKKVDIRGWLSVEETLGKIQESII